MNKPIYLDMSILGNSKILMCEFWCDHIKSKYEDRTKLCYMDTDSFVIHIKTEDFYKDIANDIEKWFDTSNYDENDDRPLSKGKNKNVIDLFKNELGGKIMKVFVGLRAKAWAYLMDDNSEKKKPKGTKKCVINHRLMVENYTDCSFNDKIILKSQEKFKSDHHVVYREEVNKIVLISNDGKRLQTLDRVTTYQHGTNAFKVCESEMMIVRDLFVENYEDCSFYN